jgi:hypothetical protein
MDLKEIGWEGVEWVHLAQGGANGSCEVLTTVFMKSYSLLEYNAL